MAYGKDYWNIDPGLLAGKSLISKAVFDSKYAFPAQPSYGYSPADQSLSLTETLDKPLYEFSEGDLHNLVSELKSMRWAEKEIQVKEIVHNFMMEYRARAHPSSSYITNTKYITMQLPVRGFRPTPVGSAGSGATVTLHSTANSITISIPVSLPPEYVHAFVERMVRDYFEEA